MVTQPSIWSPTYYWKVNNILTRPRPSSSVQMMHAFLAINNMFPWNCTRKTWRRSSSIRPPKLKIRASSSLPSPLSTSINSRNLTMIRTHRILVGLPASQKHTRRLPVKLEHHWMCPWRMFGLHSWPPLGGRKVNPYQDLETYPTVRNLAVFSQTVCSFASLTWIMYH